MIQVEASVTVQRPVTVVFAAVSDAVTEPLDQSSLAPARLQLPNASSHDRWLAAPPRPASQPAGVVLPGPLRRLAIGQGNGELRWNAVYHFDAIPGGTCVTWSSRVRATGKYWLIEAVMAQVMATEAEISLRLLKYLLEL